MSGKKYPEHERLKLVQNDSQAIGAFMEWARGFGVEFAPIGSTDINHILAQYFDIDLNEIDKEKRQMLDEMRAASSKPPASAERGES